MRRLAWLTTLVLATLTAVALLWQFREAALLFLLSLALAAAVRPLINYLNNKYGLRPSLTLILTYSLGLSIIGLLFYAVSGLLLKELQQAANDFALTYERISTTWPTGTSFQQVVAERLPAPTQFYEALAGEQGVLLLETIFGVTSGFFTLVGQLLIVLVLSIYWTADRARFERLWLSILPAEQRIHARDTWRTIETGVGAYIRSELIQGLLAGFLLGLGYWILGLKYPMILALVGVLAGLIPLVGALLAAIPALLAGLASSPALAISAALYTLVIFLILELVVEPHFFDRQYFSSLLMVFTMIVLANDLGLLGLILAPPLAVAIQIFFSHLLRRVPAAAARPTFQLADLQTRLGAVRDLMASRDDPAPVEIANMLERLSRLMEQASQLLPEELPTQP